MTVILPPAVRPQSTATDPARTLDTLVTAIVIILTIGVLFLAREILVPIAIAILLSFVLSPPVKVLRSIGLGKTISVGLVVILSFFVAVGLGFILTKQITDLAADAPRYQATVTHKVEAARDFIANNPLLAKLNTVAADLSKVTPPPASKPEVAAPPAHPAPYARTSGGSGPPEPQKPMPVEIVARRPTSCRSFRPSAARPPLPSRRPPSSRCSSCSCSCNGRICATASSGLSASAI